MATNKQRLQEVAKCPTAWELAETYGIARYPYNVFYGDVAGWPAFLSGNLQSA